ncbi:dTDP-glucose 4,6-dehydratase [Candidatus Methanoperedens nitroreducens]|uniref:dTDP-glucose 4,6-dehydratase n=1 Tax=Candidatus Methanoperedens nitratireducens TaxID=1392998 RepID=A0A062V547_9EURY|nr:dTDP-glucose 4,6-dehydratase [Candidatus Methanoperedens nitroreducens]KCZ70515.1 dTDP-glucose 4,6-dehydratase [Candidatus Methanoperedens nitroreducens]MDJ1420367.1 dTDP-glucose 4,6-dehydratase [Candidatus Methanoperedens sp.]
MRILITGGCGFIGSNFIHYILKNTDYEVINLDGLTYSGNPDNLKDIEGNERYRFIHGRIEDRKLVYELIQDAEYLVNFAAESHVDRSILDSRPFIITNIEGTQVLLEACRHSDIKKFVHISTDEVYGELGETGKFVEHLPLLPNSPYSASKASADLIIRAYHETYGLPAATARPSNNYGYYQYPEKFIPLIITNLLEDKHVPVYGEGKNIRDWIFVEDCCAGIATILNRGKTGEVYNVGGESEKRNIDIVRMLLGLLGRDESYIKFVKDRPGHDYRYALDNTKIRKEPGWSPKIDLETGLAKTVEWYKNNPSWWKPLKEKLMRESRGFWS